VRAGANNLSELAINLGARANRPPEGVMQLDARGSSLREVSINPDARASN
jgi:hypothetical protein